MLVINRPEGRAHLFRGMDYTDVKEAALVQDPSSRAGNPALDSSVRPTRRLPETAALKACTALPPRGPLGLGDLISLRFNPVLLLGINALMSVSHFGQ